MSECIICKGYKTSNLNFEIVSVELDCFLQEQALKIWKDTDEIWTIKIKEKDIDSYLTKAQKEISQGIAFEETEFYMIINELLASNVKIAMWYDTYCEDLPMCKTKEEVLKACHDGIADISGMCEVYFMMD
ncbi:MAG: hypothetical protein IJ429_01135 [Lachnospiraceae bacterium]|nr:hypothetical protein [Lachnospiraceae bacterium]